MKKILFLDFDGVLFNTVEEAYQVCINTQMFKNSILPDDSLNRFIKYRFKVGPAWNYYYIMNAIIKDNDIKSNDFLCTNEAKKFQEDFFKTRAYIKKNDYSKWIRYNKKYIFLDNIIDIIDIKIELFIVTTKDKKTVTDLFDYENIDFVSHENILDKKYFSKYESKAMIIQNVLQGYEYKAIFIDDLYSHLEECINIKNLKLVQADWGYIDKYEKSKYLLDINHTLSLIKKLGD